MSNKHHTHYENYPNYPKDTKDTKELMLKILTAEKERQDEIRKLNSELRSLEEHLETDDTDVSVTDRIDEIVNKLNIIDPLTSPASPAEKKSNTDDKNFEEFKEFKKVLRKRITAKTIGKIAKFSKISAAVACAAVLIFVSVFTFNSNILNTVTDSENDPEQEYAEISDNEDFGIRQYNTIQEFEIAENISLFRSFELPDDMVVKNVIYFYNYGIDQVTILFEDNTSMSVKLSSRSIYDNNYMPFEIAE